jgi:hypothetical protein
MTPRFTENTLKDTKVGAAFSRGDPSGFDAEVMGNAAPKVSVSFKPTLFVII